MVRINKLEERYQLPTVNFQEIFRIALEHPVHLFSMLISLFDRAYLLLYQSNMTEKQLRRWPAWEDYTGEWCNRADFRASLPVLLRREDPGFADYIQKLAASVLAM